MDLAEHLQELQDQWQQLRTKALVTRALELKKAKVRHVRTPEGAARYKLPIGSPIVKKPDVPGSFHLAKPKPKGALKATGKPKGTKPTAEQQAAHSAQWESLLDDPVYIDEDEDYELIDIDEVHQPTFDQINFSSTNDIVALEITTPAGATVMPLDKYEGITVGQAEDPDFMREESIEDVFMGVFGNEYGPVPDRGTDADNALTYYVGNHEEINDQLRKQSMGIDVGDEAHLHEDEIQRLQEWIDNPDTAIQEPMVVYRPLLKDNYGDQHQMYEIDGNEVYEAGFSTVFIDPSEADSIAHDNEGGGVVLRVRLPEGTHAAPNPEFTGGTLLLGQDTKYEVLGQDKAAGVIDVVVVPRDAVRRTPELHDADIQYVVSQADMPESHRPNVNPLSQYYQYDEDLARFNPQGAKDQMLYSVWRHKDGTKPQGPAEVKAHQAYLSPAGKHINGYLNSEKLGLDPSPEQKQHRQYIDGLESYTFKNYTKDRAITYKRMKGLDFLFDADGEFQGDGAVLEGAGFGSTSMAPSIAFPRPAEAGEFDVRIRVPMATEAATGDPDLLEMVFPQNHRLMFIGYDPVTRQLDAIVVPRINPPERHPITHPQGPSYGHVDIPEGVQVKPQHEYAQWSELSESQLWSGQATSVDEDLLEDIWGEPNAPRPDVAEMDFDYEEDSQQYARWYDAYEAYTHWSYKYMNQFARDLQAGNRPGLEQRAHAQNFQAFQEWVDMHEIVNDTLVYRSLRGFGDVPNSERFKAGLIHLEPGFTSTATHLSSAEAFKQRGDATGVTLRIRLPKGTKAVGGNEFENEIVVRDGTRYYMLGYDPGDDVYDAIALPQREEDRVTFTPEVWPIGEDGAFTESEYLAPEDIGAPFKFEEEYPVPPNKSDYSNEEDWIDAAFQALYAPEDLANFIMPEDAHDAYNNIGVTGTGLNRWLREGPINPARPTYWEANEAQPMADALRRHVDSFQTQEDALVYRGVQPYDDFSPAMVEPGYEWSDRGFNTAVFDADEIHRYSNDKQVENAQSIPGIVYRIRVPKGTTMAPADADHGEVIFPPGTRYKVVGRDENGVVDVVVLP